MASSAAAAASAPSPIDRLESQLSDNVASVAHSVAGGLSGMVSQVLWYPLETLKYQQQAVGSCKSLLKANCDGGAMDRSREEDAGMNPGMCKNGLREKEYEIQPAMWSDLLKPEFYKTAYNGLGISLLETGCFHGTHFYFYTLLKKMWLRANKDAEQMTPMASIFNGSLAGLLVQLITSPLKVLQINSVLYKNKSAIEIAVQIWKEKGPAGFWKGFGLNTFLVLNPAITFFIYERIRDRLNKMGFSSALIDFLCGFFGKVIATFLTYPVMLIKTRILSAKGPKTVMDVIREVNEGGLLGWYEGLGAKMAQTTLTNAFVFMCKEQLVHYTLKFFVLLFAIRKAKIAKSVSSIKP